MIGSSVVKMLSRRVTLQGRKRILLYTERAHFYFRYRIGGVKVSKKSICGFCALSPCGLATASSGHC